MKFDKEWLRELSFCGVGSKWEPTQDGPGCEILWVDKVDESRWMNIYEMVFRSAGKCYLLRYEDGKTEQQESSTFDHYAPDEIECPEVRVWEETETVVRVKYKKLK